MAEELIRTPEEVMSDQISSAAAGDQSMQDIFATNRERQIKSDVSAERRILQGGEAKREIMARTYLRDNVISNSIDFLAEKGIQLLEDEPGDFDPIAAIPQGYETFVDRFSKAESPQAIERIKRRIDEESEVDFYRNDSPVTAAALQMSGAILDVTSFLPVGAAVNVAARVPGKAGILLAGVAGGVSTGAAVATSEAVAQMAQETRTKQESYDAIMYSTALGGLLTVAGTAIGRRLATNRAVREMEQMPPEVQQAIFREESALKNMAEWGSKEKYEALPIRAEAETPKPNFAQAKAMAQSDDLVTLNVGQAIQEFEPNFLKMYDMVESGNIPVRMDISNDIQKAVEIVAKARETEVPVARILAEVADTVDDRVAAVVRLMHKNDELTEVATNKEITARLDAYTEKAKAAKYEATEAFDEKPVMPESIINEVLKDAGSATKVRVPNMTADAQIKSDIQAFAKKENALRKALAAIKKTDEAGSAGGSGGSKAVFDKESVRLLNEERSRIQGKIMGLDGFGIFKKQTTSTSFGLATSKSKVARLYGARLIDVGLEFDDPVFVRNGQVPAAIAKEMEVNILHSKIEGINRAGMAAFKQEALKAGITKGWKDVYRQELHRALVRKDGASNYNSVRSAAFELGRIRDDLIKRGIDNGLIESDAVKFAEKYMPRVYNTAKIAENPNAFVDYVVSKMKQYMRDETNPHYDMLQKVAKEYENRATADVQALYGITDPDRIDDFINESFDQFMYRVAREAKNNITSPNLTDGKLMLKSAFQNMKRDRILAIPDEDLIADGWVISDPINSLANLSRRMTAEVNLVKYMETTDVNDILKKIDDDFDQMEARGEIFGKEAFKARDESKHHMVIAWSKYLDTFGYLANPATNSGLGAAFLRTTTPFVDAAILDSALFRNAYELLYAMKEDVGITFKHLAKAIPNMTSDLGKMKKADLRRMGIALELQLRPFAYQDPGIVSSRIGRGSKIETGAQNFNVFYRTWGDLTYPFQNFLDGMNGSIIQELMIKRIPKVAAGTASKKELRFVRSLGLSDDMVKRMAKQLDQHTINEQGYLFDNNQKWDDFEAAEMFRKSVFYGKKRITPNVKYDTPSVLQDNFAGVFLGKYVGAVMSAYQRAILATSQESVATAVGMALAVTAIGTLRAMINDAIQGKEPDQPENYLLKGILNGGAAGLTGDVINRWNYTRNPYGSDVELSKAYTGVHQTFMQKAYNAGEGAYSVAIGEKPTKQQIGNFIDLFPANNVIYFKPIFNGIEDEIRANFGYDERYGAPFSGEIERKENKK